MSHTSIKSFVVFWTWKVSGNGILESACIEPKGNTGTKPRSASHHITDSDLGSMLPSKTSTVSYFTLTPSNLLPNFLYADKMLLVRAETGHTRVFAQRTELLSQKETE